MATEMVPVGALASHLLRRRTAPAGLVPGLSANAARQVSVRTGNCVRGLRREFNPDPDLCRREPIPSRPPCAPGSGVSPCEPQKQHAGKPWKLTGAEALIAWPSWSSRRRSRLCDRVTASCCCWPPERSPRRPSMPLSTAHSSNSSSGTERRSRRSGGEGRAQVLQHRELREANQGISDRVLLGEILRPAIRSATLRRRRALTPRAAS